MNPMLQSNEPAILLVRDGTLLPPDVPVETVAFLPGWRIVKNFDSYSMRRKITGTDWKFLLLRGGKETRVMGRERPKILRQAVAQILDELKDRKFNSLEVNVLVSRSFLGMNLLNIAVNLRHFQCSTAV
jgi:hypothetical protein